MDLSNLTTRSQQALAAAMQQAAAAGNPAIEPAHVLVALLAQDGGTATPLLQAAGNFFTAALNEWFVPS